MAKVSVYLNFERNTEEAFNFYKTVFNSNFIGGGFARFKDIPPTEDSPQLPEEDKDLIMHVSLPILGGYLLMGTDAPKSMGFQIEKGNNVHISLEPDTKEETRELFDKLSQGGKISMELQDMFWGAYYGSCIDKFGVHWMFNCRAVPKVMIEVTVQCEVKKVWEYWTKPEHICKWNQASEDWHTPSASVDLRNGGKFVSRMEARDGSAGFDFSGVYLKVIPQSFISFAIDDGRNVEVIFIESGKETKIIEIFEAESQNPVEMQKNGWQSILNTFKKYAEL